MNLARTGALLELVADAIKKWILSRIVCGDVLTISQCLSGWHPKWGLNVLILRRYLLACEPADPDNMFSSALSMVRRQVIPPVEKATKVRDPARGVKGPPNYCRRPVLRINNSSIPLCTRMVRKGASMDASMPVLESVSRPSEHGLVGRCRTCAK